jgi:hypothetical protein
MKGGWGRGQKCRGGEAEVEGGKAAGCEKHSFFRITSFTLFTPCSALLLCLFSGARATLGRGGIMNLLFGHHRGLHSGHEVFRDMPRLPLPLQPMQGDLAASINRGTRGLDIGQADPVWVSCASPGGGDWTGRPCLGEWCVPRWGGGGEGKTCRG